MCVLPQPHHKPWNGNDPEVYLCWNGNDWVPSDLGDKPERKGKSTGHLSNYRAGQARREKFLELLPETGRIDATCERLGMSKSTYDKWRRKYPEFAAKVDIARKIDFAADRPYDADFATFRRIYLNNESTWFQHQAVEALEACQEGEIIMLLWPPEHGKTTTIEDFINYKLAIEPQTRITVVSEKQSHAIKVLRRVKNRMEKDGPAPHYVRTFGPFTPDDGKGGSATAQPWANDHFDVRKRGVFDERDYSCVAVGITTGVQGTRSDWMIIDDPQSLKSLGSSEAYVDILRQDFFSRPGMFGRICILGTRVGNLDVYERLIEEGLIDKLIIFPAHDVEGNWLWPERYSPQMYEKMHKRVGDQAWYRNYMQRPSAARDAAFTPEIIEPCLNPSRSVIADAPQDYDDAGHPLVLPVVVCLDPALGSVNSITALGFGRKQLSYLGSRVDTGFTRNEEIFDALEQVIIRWTQPGVSQVAEVVIETMNFQKGLANDDRVAELQRRYGFRLVPHLTGTNKYDENIGVTSMPMSFMRREIDLPYADAPSQREIDAFVHELYAWRPYKRGNRLRQDRVMSFWFGWLRWRSRRTVTTLDTSQFDSTPSPLRRPA